MYFLAMAYMSWGPEFKTCFKPQARISHSLKLSFYQKYENEQAGNGISAWHICINSAGWKAFTHICDHNRTILKLHQDAQFSKHFHDGFLFVTDQTPRFVQVPFIVNTLWDALLDLDDLTASTNSIMTLLSLLLTYPQVQQCRSVSTWKKKISLILTFLFLLWRIFFCHQTPKVDRLFSVYSVIHSASVLLD